LERRSVVAPLQMTAGTRLQNSPSGPSDGAVEPEGILLGALR
jgi:hypothetical protein